VAYASPLSGEQHPSGLVSALERVQVSDRIQPRRWAACWRRNGCPTDNTINLDGSGGPLDPLACLSRSNADRGAIFRLTWRDALLGGQITRPAAPPFFSSGARSAIGDSGLTKHQALRCRDRITFQVEWSKRRPCRRAPVGTLDTMDIHVEALLAADTL